MRTLTPMAVFALMISTAAFAGTDHHADKDYGDKDKKVAADMADKPEAASDKAMIKKADAMGAQRFLAANEISAKEFLGEGVRGGAGERIARVDDFLIDDSGRASKAILISGGVFGFGGHKGMVDFGTLDIDVENRYEPLIRTGMSEDSVKKIAEFDQEQLNNYNLASEIIGTMVDLSSVDGDEDDAVINDLIMTRSGEIKGIVLQDTVVGPIGFGERYVLPYSTLTVEQGDGGLFIEATEDAMKAAPRFTGERRWNDVKNAADEAGEAVEKTWQETGEAVEGAANATGEAIDDAADATGDAVSDAADATGDAVEEATDEVEDAADDLDDNR